MLPGVFLRSIQLISLKLSNMIQRIQTIWLLLAASAAFAGFTFSFYSGTKLNDITLHELNASSTLLLMVATLAVGGLALVNIFLFKQRAWQFRLCILGILLEAARTWLFYREATAFTQGNYSLTAVLHGIIILAFILAARGIQKDAKMVKDSDRLR